jgi:hypothetical protein
VRGIGFVGSVNGLLSVALTFSWTKKGCKNSKKFPLASRERGREGVSIQTDIQTNKP